MTQATATLYGLGDRGVLAPGYIGDANVIDHASLQLRRPELGRLVAQSGDLVAEGGCMCFHTTDTN